MSAPTPPPTPRVVDVSLDETLKRLRAELRREFPTTRFSIRRARGTAYGWVDVQWTDGPRYAEVSEIADSYAGAGFDGMTDSSYAIKHLAADGEGAPILLRYGTRGINCSRTHSVGEVARVARVLLEKCADAALDADERIRLRELDAVSLAREVGRVRLWADYLSTLCHRALEATDGTLYDLVHESSDA